MRLYPLALAAGLLPLVTVHICYIWAASAGDISACVPYLHSCTSISSAGREGPQFYIFKGLMIPAAVVIFVFWMYCCQWLRALGSQQLTVVRIIIILSAAACFGLILYTLMLGAIGPEFRVQRRLGVIIFFSMSFISQCLFIFAASRLHFNATVLKREFRLLRLCLAIIVMFAISAVLISSIDSDVYDSVEDAFEWWVTLLLCFFPLLVAAMWRKTHFKVTHSVKL